METIYCTLDARRLTLCRPLAGRKVSGGETVCYAVSPRPRPAPRPAGRVINLDDYRPSARAGGEAAPAAPEAAEAPRPAARRRCSPALAADLLASAAVVVLLAVVAIQTLML